MPELVLFRGRPVKRQRRIGDRLHLVFLGEVPGQPGQKLTVSQADWALFGSVQFYSKEQLPNARALAAQIGSVPDN